MTIINSLKKGLLWIWHKWLPIAHAIGNFQAQLILTVFYVVVLLPLGIIMRFFVDPLKTNLYKSRARTSFTKWTFPKEDLNSAKKQY